MAAQVLYCFDCITREMCPPAHCDPADGVARTPHDPAAVDFATISPAVSMYHGRALCLTCLAGYLDEV